MSPENGITNEDEEKSAEHSDNNAVCDECECPSTTSENNKEAPNKDKVVPPSPPNRTGNNESRSNKSITTAETAWKATKKKRLNQDSLVFSTRISAALTVCSLFFLLDNPNPSERVYPDATWVYITACICLWLPPTHPLDALSISLQMIRMLLGSVVAAALSISLGSLAVSIDNDKGRAFFIGCCIAFVTFGYCFLVVRYNLLPDMSASVGLFLFCISLFPFLSDHASAWRDALFRVSNTWFGCLIALMASLCVFPRSTRWALQQQLVDQVELAGDCVHLLLCKACNVFSGKLTTRNMTSLLEETRKGSDPDEAHEAYSVFFQDVFASTGTVDLLRHQQQQQQHCRYWCNNKTDSLQKEADQTTSQAFLVVTTVQIMDSYIQHQEVLLVDSDTLENFNRLGGLIKSMLSPNETRTKTEEAANQLLRELNPLSRLILEAAKNEQQTCYLQDLKDVLSRPNEKMPVSVSAEGSELFFLQLTEQLILQSLRLHYIWIQNETCLSNGVPTQACSSETNAQSPVVVQDSSLDSSMEAAERAETAGIPESEVTDAASISESQSLQQMGTMELDGRNPAQESLSSSAEKSVDKGDTSTQAESGKPDSSWKSQKTQPAESSKMPQHEMIRDSALSTPVDEIQNAGSLESAGSIENKGATRNEDAAKFSIRMSICMTLSSLFVLLDSPEPGQQVWPQASWVLVSAVVVSWYPTLDTASIVYKTVERIFGTVMAAILGWSCGLLAVLIQDDQWRCVFLGVCNTIITFAYALVGYRSEVYGSHQYGSFVGIFTFSIVLFPFTGGEVDSWWTGLYRIINVLIGCLIACLSALLIFPRSTRNALRRQITQQVAEAGVSVNAVLSSIESNGTRDDTYRNILSDHKSFKDMYGVLGADPFLKRSERKRGSTFRKEAAMTRARILRIETTAVLLENTKPSLLTMPEFCMKFGTNIEALLKVDGQDTETLSDEILSELAEMQPLLLEARTRASEKSQSNIQDSVAAMREALCRLDGSSVPMCSEASSEVLCLLLVEHLVLRALKLYYAWSQNTYCTALQ